MISAPDMEPQYRQSARASFTRAPDFARTPTMLGLAAGIYFFISNAVGIGIGPTLVAAITDYAFEDPDMIRYSLSMVGGVSRAIAFVLFLVGLKYYRDLMRKREGSAA